MGVVWVGVCQHLYALCLQMSMREEGTGSAVRRMRGGYCFSCEENERGRYCFNCEENEREGFCFNCEENERRGYCFICEENERKILLQL